MINNLELRKYYERQILVCGRYLYNNIPNLQAIQLPLPIYDREDDSKIIYATHYKAVLVQPGEKEGGLLEEGPQCSDKDEIKALPGLLEVLQDKVRKAISGTRKFYEQ